MKTNKKDRKDLENRSLGFRFARHLMGQHSYLMNELIFLQFTVIHHKYFVALIHTSALLLFVLNISIQILQNQCQNYFIDKQISPKIVTLNKHYHSFARQIHLRRMSDKLKG